MFGSRGKRNFEGCKIKRVIADGVTARLDCAITGPEGFKVNRDLDAHTSNLIPLIGGYVAEYFCKGCTFADMDVTTFNEQRMIEAEAERERLAAELRLLEIRAEVARKAAELRLLQSTITLAEAPQEAQPTAIAPPPAPPAIES